MTTLELLVTSRGAKSYKTRKGAQAKLDRAEALYCGAKKDETMPVLTTIVSGTDVNGRAWFVPVAFVNSANVNLAGFLAHQDIFVTDGVVRS